MAQDGVVEHTKGQQFPALLQPARSVQILFAGRRITGRINVNEHHGGCGNTPGRPEHIPGSYQSPAPTEPPRSRSAPEAGDHASPLNACRARRPASNVAVSYLGPDRMARSTYLRIDCDSRFHRKRVQRTCWALAFTTRHSRRFLRCPFALPVTEKFPLESAPTYQLQFINVHRM
jgi:hypothetical protein